MQIIKTILLLLCCTSLYSQTLFPKDGRVFNDSEVPRVDITLSQQDLDNILENVQSDDLYPAHFKWTDLAGQINIEGVGLRLRGNSSRVSAKKSFKIKFKAFGGQEFYGLSDLNLNGEHNDPTISRSNLCWDLLKKAQIPSARANHVELYINGEYRGLYANIEHIDKDYLNFRYFDNTGNLYKLYYGCSLQYINDNPNSYKFISNGERVYDLKTNEAIDDYSKLAQFIKILNSPTITDYQCKLESIFDVDLYLRSMAMEVLLGHWDNPIFNQNNAYLYEDPHSGQIKYIPFDLDNTFGIDWFGIDWSERDIYQWDDGSNNRPLYTNLLAIDEYRQRYSFYINKFIDLFYNDVDLFGLVNDLRIKLEPFVINDTYHSLDYGYGINEFNNNFNNAIGAHVKSGIKEFIERRSVNAKLQLEAFDISPILNFDNANIIDNNVVVSLQIQAQSLTSTKLHYFKDGNWFEIALLDDGNGFDQTENDNRFTASIPFTSNGIFEYYIEAIDSQNKVSRLPYCNQKILPYVYTTSLPNGLRINEFMADNKTVADEFGDFDDWIELYNNSAEVVDLSDYYLTDNLINPNKWNVPQIMLKPYGFLLIWADEDGAQGPLHSNFKLSKSGEQIGLFKNKENSSVLIDSLTYAFAKTNTSYGLIPNGEGTYSELPTITPGSSNIELNSLDELHGYVIDIFPNPAHNLITLNTSSDVNVNKISIIGLTGQKYQANKINKQGNMVSFDISNLDKGYYFFICQTNLGIITKRIIKM